MISKYHFTRNSIAALATMAIFSLSCNSGDVHQRAVIAADSPVMTTPPVYDISFQKGKVTDSIICRNGSQNYALYLPSDYDTAKQFPCIYFFDSHGCGVLPVSTYKELAEKYSFIFIGSNASKNGIPWVEANDAAKTLMADTRAHININPNRIYTAGFSGGSRVAVTIAILDGGVAGVIGCAAGFPKVKCDLQGKFDYFGIVGDYDFNWAEMKEWDKTLEQNGFRHQLLTSGGKHGWATIADFNTALLWEQVAAMKQNLQPKNDSIITAFKKDYDKRMATAKLSGDWIKAYELLNGMVSVLDGLQDIPDAKKQLASFAAGADYKKAVELQAQLQKQEEDQQQQLVNEYSKQNEQWLTRKVAELDKKGHGSKIQEAQMNQRLLNYFGFISYASANHALMTGDLVNAATYIKVFKMADPKNPDGDYLSAVYNMKKGDAHQALSSLNEAASLGYNDLFQLLVDPVFTGLQGDAAFSKLLAKVKENSKSK